MNIHLETAVSSCLTLIDVSEIDMSSSDGDNYFQPTFRKNVNLSTQKNMPEKIWLFPRSIKLILRIVLEKS